MAKSMRKMIFVGKKTLKYGKLSKNYYYCWQSNDTGHSIVFWSFPRHRLEKKLLQKLKKNIWNRKCCQYWDNEMEMLLAMDPILCRDLKFDS